MSKVNLVSISQPNKEFTGCETAEQLVAWCARVSNPSNMENHKTAPNLLKYLIKHKHWSPLEMVSVSMHIVTTRDIARQILRHRSFSFQEYSQRYADPTKDLNIIPREARLQDIKNRQNSISNDNDTLEEMWKNKQELVAATSKYTYKWAIDNGIAKEVARSVLPEGLTESVLIMSGTLRSWVHYIDLRTGKETQKEHRVVADQCKEVITNNFPAIIELFEQKE